VAHPDVTTREGVSRKCQGKVRSDCFCTCVCVCVCVRRMLVSMCAGVCVRAVVGIRRDVVLRISMPLLTWRAWGGIWCLKTVCSEASNWTGSDDENYHCQPGVAQPALLPDFRLNRRVILVRQDISCGLKPPRLALELPQPSTQ